MKLPNSRAAFVDRAKITEYLLSSVNPRGRSKANFFIEFGFSTDNWEDFADALMLHGTSQTVTRVVETNYGPRYHVDGVLETPDGRNPAVRTVWQFDAGATYPRLITAYPLRR